MISTILRNLISNAIKFTHFGGKVIINAFQEKNEVVVSINDNGIGINPDIIEKLIDNSGILHTIGTNQEIGTGIGLELCKDLIQKHNGKIWVESKVNDGSTFYFTIPVCSPSA